MLLSFSVSNFRSFQAEQTLSMVASKRQTDHPDHLEKLPDSDESLLRAAVVYGPNGSGKSNLTRALKLVQKLINEGTPSDKAIARQPFAFRAESAGEPSSFQIRFLREGWAFDYGFKITDREVTEEWLFLMGSSETRIFERSTAEGKVVVEVGRALRDAKYGNHEKVAALAAIGVRANQLFLAGIRETINATEHGPLFTAVLGWFAALVIVPPTANFMGLAQLVANRPDFTEFAGRFLRDAGTGISTLKVDTTEITDLSALSGSVREMVEDIRPGEVRMKRGEIHP